MLACLKIRTWSIGWKLLSFFLRPIMVRRTVNLSHNKSQPRKRVGNRLVDLSRFSSLFHQWNLVDMTTLSQIGDLLMEKILTKPTGIGMNCMKIGAGFQYPCEILHLPHQFSCGCLEQKQPISLDVIVKEIMFCSAACSPSPSPYTSQGKPEATEEGLSATFQPVFC